MDSKFELLSRPRWSDAVGKPVMRGACTKKKHDGGAARWLKMHAGLCRFLLRLKGRYQFDAKKGHIGSFARAPLGQVRRCERRRKITAALAMMSRLRSSRAGCASRQDCLATGAVRRCGYLTRACMHGRMKRSPGWISLVSRLVAPARPDESRPCLFVLQHPANQRQTGADVVVVNSFPASTKSHRLARDVIRELPVCGGSFALNQP